MLAYSLVQVPVVAPVDDRVLLDVPGGERVLLDVPGSVPVLRDALGGVLRHDGPVGDPRRQDVPAECHQETRPSPGDASIGTEERK